MSIIFAGALITYGLCRIADGLMRLAEAVSQVTSRYIVIEKEPLRSDPENGWKATVKL